MLVAIPDKIEHTVAKALVERVFGIFGPPEALHSDQGPEFESKEVKQLQDGFCFFVGAYAVGPACHAFDV